MRTNPKEAKSSDMVFEEVRTGLNRQTPRRFFEKTEAFFGRSKGLALIVITLNPVPKEETFPIPLEHIDVIRRTHRPLDVVLESRTDDCWNFDGDRNSSVPWISFPQFTILNEHPPDGYTWSGERLTATTWPDHFMATDLVRNVECRSTKRKTAAGKRKTEARHCKKVEAFLIRMTRRSSKKPLKNARKRWNCAWKQPCPVN